MGAVKYQVKSVFILTPVYMKPNKQDWMRKRMDEYGVVCARLEEKHGCILVDLQSTFDRYFQYRHSSYFAWDRIHPNLIGATIIAREFLSRCGFDYYVMSDIHGEADRFHAMLEKIQFSLEDTRCTYWVMWSTRGQTGSAC